MKTRELIRELEYVIENQEAKLKNEDIQEIIKRLEELEELKEIIKNPHLTQDHTMQKLIDLVTNIVNE